MREQMLKLADRLDVRGEARTQNTVNAYWREFDYCKQEGKECLTPPPQIDEISMTLHIFAEEIRETLETVEYREFNPENGDLYTIEKFEKQCGYGIIDSDGNGYYAREIDGGGGKMKMVESSLPAVPSRIAGGDVNREFTHVVWYNK